MPLVLKLKPAGREISAMLAGLAQACGGPVAEVYPTFQALTGFEHTHWRELQAYAQPDPSGLLPQVWATHADPAQDTYLVLLEYLEEGRNVTLLNSVMQPERWTDAHIRVALTQLAGWHATHLGATPTARTNYGPDTPSGAFMQRLAPLWSALLTNAATHLPTLYTPAREAQFRAAIAAIPTYWFQLENHPHHPRSQRPEPAQHLFQNHRRRAAPPLCLRLGAGHLPPPAIRRSRTAQLRARR